MSIITPFPVPRARWAHHLRNRVHQLTRPGPLPLKPPGLPALRRVDPHNLPRLVRESAVAMNYLRLLRPLAWQRFPRRSARRPWPGPVPRSPVPYVAAFLVRLDQGHSSMAQLRRYLVEHPALTWVLGFPLVPSSRFPWGFDVDASLPSAHRFSRIFSQALALGIERPKLRNRCSITNWNTLIYTLINLRALQRILRKRTRNEVG